MADATAISRFAEALGKSEEVVRDALRLCHLVLVAPSVVNMRQSADEHLARHAALGLAQPEGSEG